MNNYRFTISYDGSRYSGWEHQKHTDDTIQGKIEAVLAKMCDTDTVKLVGAGRTDAGVHAKAMTANALLDTTLPVREIRDYMNRYLPDDIVILEAAALLQGQHDFASFCGNPKMNKSTVRTVDSIRIQQKGDYLTLSFHGDGFLQHMVRIMTGTLLEVGFHRMQPNDVITILQGKKRSLAGPTAPAQGLCLIEVDYN